MRRSALSLLAAAAIVLVSPQILGQTQTQVAQARKWFKEGDDAEKAADFATALERFQQAIAIKETPQLWLRIGNAQEKLGRLRDALASYRQGLQKANAANLAPAVKLARDQIESLYPRIPNVTLKVKKPIAGMTVEFDDKPLAAASVEAQIDLDPGPHKVVAQAPGYVRFEKAFPVAERDALHVDLDLVPEVVVDPDAGRFLGGRLPTLLWFAGGAVGIGAGAALFAAAKGTDGTVDKQCGSADRLHCPGALKAQIGSEVSTVDTLEALAGVSAGLGVASAVVGTYLLLKKPPSSDASPPRAAFEVVPVFGPRDAAVLARGRF